MIKHIVLFKLKNPTPSECERAKEVLLSMRGKVPEIVDMEVGIDFLHSERSYDVALQVTVADRAALDSYQSDYYHVTVVKPHMHAARSGSVAIDYEI
ncbi:MAG TPA: Dabb family protein [Candidatus Stercoripulliclostridium merdigallinarum]|uniref:Dabb family protein n=1 Tax=Candidatus Stercoripulliclostridium merdigallinarum TaxID=2840951 RepID=A0A9D1MIC8_9FIRM|nr:Dabb family protein [Candidatus Stercoripulliclostridium merdigallinarum]